MAKETDNVHFCSHLVTAKLPASDGRERELVANLEEISTSGACLNAEEPVIAGLSLRLICSDRGQKCEYLGKVVDCEHDPYTGYYLRIAFDPGVQWSPQDFHPRHSLRAADLVPGAPCEEQPAREIACCDRGVCPKEVVATVLEPEFPLSGRIRAAAQDVAALCGEMNRAEAEECFGSLFGAGPECSLFAGFLEAYEQARQKGAIKPQLDLRSHVEALVSIAGAIESDEVRTLSH